MRSFARTCYQFENESIRVFHPDYVERAGFELEGDRLGNKFYALCRKVAVRLPHVGHAETKMGMGGIAELRGGYLTFGRVILLQINQHSWRIGSAQTHHVENHAGLGCHFGNRFAFEMVAFDLFQAEQIPIKREGTIQVAYRYSNMIEYVNACHASILYET